MLEHRWLQHVLSPTVRIIFFIIISCAAECAKLPQRETIVFPRILDSRSIDEVRVVKISEDLTLNLEKSSVVAKEFLLRTYQEGFMQHTYLDGEALEEDLYHDSRSLASVMLSEENGLRVEGILGPTLRIKPLEGQKRMDEGNIAHVLYEYRDDGSNFDVKGIITTESRANVSERQYQQGQALPDTVYPELLVLVDSTLRNQFSADAKVIKYFIMTMNAVNLRYTTVSQPNVRLILQAIEILTSTEETFLERVPPNRVEGYATLEKLRVYVQRHPQKYATYDVVYLATGLDMGYMLSKGWDPGLRGIAYIGGACGSEKVGYGEDSVGSFAGVRVLAHEVGHILGCPHDGQGVGLFDSRNCPWDDGFIMSYSFNSSKSMKFSQCCNNMITLKVRLLTGLCLRVQTAKRKIKKLNYTELLPGDIYDRNRICRMAFPNVTKTRFQKEKDGSERCHAWCSMPRKERGPDKPLRVLLPDNSPCNEMGGKVCINGDCVKKKKRPRAYRPYI